MNKLNLVSPLCCSVNHYLKPRPFISNGKAMVTMYETTEAKKYKKEFSQYIKEQVKFQDFNIIPNKTQHFYVDCIFYFDRVDKDANNYMKLLLDSITDSQCVWIDDNVSCERIQAIYYDTKYPRIELTIYPVDYIGIFDNQEQLDKFESNCIQCTKYKERKCNVYCRAIEGRIQEEIKDMKCFKYKKMVAILMQNDLCYNRYNYCDIKVGDIVAFDIGLQLELTKNEEILLVKVLEITNAHCRTYPTAYIKRLEDWKIEEEAKKENPNFKGKKPRQVSVAWLFNKKNIELIRHEMMHEIENINEKESEELEKRKRIIQERIEYALTELDD